MKKRMVWIPLAMLALVLVAAGCQKATPTAEPTQPPAAIATAAPTAVPTEAQPEPTSAPSGVTALQVQQLIAEKFNTANRDLLLWNIQPGLGTIMMEYGRRIATAERAVQAGDWGMAQYQLHEAVEIQEVGETTRPGKADLLANFEHTYLDPLADDILAMDTAAFNEDFGNTVDACNACHQATGHPYVVFQAPSSVPVDFLALGPSEAQAPGEEGSAPTTTPALDEPITWAQLDQMVNDAFNAVDRSLALWNIQPGLGTIMMEYGRRIATTHQAVQAGDWGMAQYQLHEAVEIQEVGETTRPGKSDLLANFEHTYLDSLADDILAKDTAAFNEDFGNTVDACNACHQATGHPYVVFQAPGSTPRELGLLTFGPSEPEAPGEEGSAPSATSPSYPSGNPTIEDANSLIDERLNTLDRALALWNIQPGLGTIMTEYGYRFAVAWFAAEAGDWGMAQYQLHEAIEYQEVGEATRPAKAELLSSFEHGYLDALLEAVVSEDKAGFETAYQNAIQGCNACHQATGHAYVVVSVPATLPADFLIFGASSAAP